MTVETINASQQAFLTLTPVKSQLGEKNSRHALNSLRPHTHISSDFDQLKFNAAASLQLERIQESSQPSPVHVADTRLIASPYNGVHHLLDLDTLDTQSRLLALALSYLKPVRDDYATAEYLDSFNWEEVFHRLSDLAEREDHTWRKQSFYVVSFRSKLQPNIDNEYLHALDAYSHQEAVASGGLLKYWFGSKNQERQNLATCIWRNRDDARLGGRGPWHAKARAAARSMYESIVFSTMELVIEDHVGSWEIRDWRDVQA